MTKKVHRRMFLKSMLYFAFAGLALSAGGYSYSRYLEPKLLDVEKIEFTSPKLPQSFSGIKAVQFSDTHLSDHYTLEQLKNIKESINALSPDLVFFTGDLIDDPLHYKEKNGIISQLADIKAPLGKFSVFGNHDHGGYGSNIYAEVMMQSGFTMLKNESRDIRLADGAVITVSGLDDLMLGKPDYQNLEKGLSEETFNILLAHEPDAWLHTKKLAVDVQLSGHSHGGQVQLPFYGPLITPPFADIYTEGLYEYGEMKLYVNRGLGTTRVPFRFLSMPELTVFTFNKA
ncbi:metallophosphoesterase [Metabacillus sp. 113a]|uniref:metallophosphoesterase n=1 Tax=Metabacillus sp. 113a TaxID=3404706 RepID=UPI003CF48F64